MKKENKVSFTVYGRYAMFSDPLTRLGGEHFSYQVPTYEALKGILKSAYWKPTFIWVIDRCRIMKKIQTETKAVKPLAYMTGKSDLSYHTYLYDVEYQVEAHFEWNEQRQELIQDRDENKHWLIAKRMIERGGRRDIFLGTRECQGYIEPCEFGSGVSDYDEIPELAFGFMFHGFDYPDECGGDKIMARFDTITMKKGIIEFARPDQCKQKKIAGHSSVIPFVSGVNFKGVDEFDLE